MANRRHHYYSCRGALSKGKAIYDRPTRIPLKQMNEVVLDAVVEQVVKEERLDELLGAIVKERDQKSKHAIEDLVKLKKDALEKNKAVDNLYLMVTADLVDVADEDFVLRFNTKENCPRTGGTSEP